MREGKFNFVRWHRNSLIGKMLGGGVGTWQHIQAAYDAWHAEREVDVTHVKALKAA